MFNPLVDPLELGALSMGSYRRGYSQRVHESDLTGLFVKGKKEGYERGLLVGARAGRQKTLEEADSKLKMAMVYGALSGNGVQQLRDLVKSDVVERAKSEAYMLGSMTTAQRQEEERVYEEIMLMKRMGRGCAYVVTFPDKPKMVLSSIVAVNNATGADIAQGTRWHYKFCHSPTITINNIEIKRYTLRDCQ